ncbi:MAG TPA: nuclear transport factor 2 family protein [Acidimicrobiia bacterium]|nr:nuclear transport factor 2 family protein [Acidimicrobiia bacterium]
MGIPDQVGVSSEDIEAIEKAALDYLEGYVSGDAQRHHGSYHPEAIKRRYNQGEDGVFAIASLSPQTMADWAARQNPKDIGDVEIIIDGVYNDIATVRVYSQWWVDFLHVVKARGSWKLFHVTWYNRESVED